MEENVKRSFEHATSAARAIGQASGELTAGLRDAHSGYPDVYRQGLRTVLKAIREAEEEVLRASIALDA